ncbi:hypothetical protein ASZ90_013684 [hydrocarbon metagenome]|uniref:Uncharacterized protein n=1 Tax=hydrocarbon metagenome TaxID=938273 RepID=A0A0W8F881_9ZZZZ
MGLLLEQRRFALSFKIEDIRRMSLAGKREKAFWGGNLARTVPEVGPLQCDAPGAQGHHQRRA